MHANWKDRLNEWAPEPPGHVWENLSMQLEEPTALPFAQKLHQFEAKPPEAAWNKIQAQLETKQRTPVIRLFSRNRYVQYGSIAASILAAVFLFRQFYFGNDAVNQSRPALQQQVFPLPSIPKNESVTTVQNEYTWVPAATAPASTDLSAGIPVLQKASGPLPTTAPERKSETAFSELIPSAPPQINDGFVERYIVMPIGDDGAIRIPKKLYDLFRCGELSQSAECAELIQSLRRRSAAPSLSASADFAGLLELIQQVDNP